MKAFSDLEQSKKLAEILPIESADMHWQYVEEDNGQLQWFSFPKDFSINQQGSLPCWSLAALIGVLPRYLNYNDDKLRLNLYTLDFENLYRKDHCWIVGYWDYDEETETFNFQIEAREDELIDACYELILKLNERKLLN